MFAMPSVGVFYTQEWDPGLRSYEGLALGAEFGLLNSFEGQVFTLNCVLEVEWILSARKSVFLEFGSGVGILPKEEAFNGGSVIGGGMKYWL